MCKASVIFVKYLVHELDGVRGLVTDLRTKNVSTANKALKIA